MVPESIMPGYPWLLENELDYTSIEKRMRALRMTGVPYALTEEENQANVDKYGPEVAAKLDITRADDSLIEQAIARNYDGDPSRLTEMDALVAYLQMLGTLVDFSKYEQGHFAEFR